MDDVAISVEGLGKQYRIWGQSKPQSLSDRVALALSRNRRSAATAQPQREELWALRGASFEVRRGEVLGVIGPNGAGKSTLLTILSRITEPSEGRAVIRGRVGSLLEIGTGFHPELSGRDNIYLNGSIIGMSRAEVNKKFEQIVDFSGVRDFIDMPVKRYSSGMYVRLAFSVAAHLEPEVLLLDEVLAVGDRSFQEKCLHRIDEIAHDGRTVLFVSHDLLAVARLCKRAIIIDEGHVVFDGTVDEALDRYDDTHSLGDEPGAASVRHEGTGEARVAAMRIETAGGSPVVRAGEPFDVVVEFDAERPVPGDGLTLSIGVHSAGVMYALLSTEFHQEHPLAAGIERGTRLVCTVEGLPLRPGRYTLSATLERLGKVIDRVSGEALFRIAPSDVYGTGVVSSESHVAPVIVRHRWSAADRMLTTRTP